MLSLGKGGNLAFALYFAARLGKGVFANAVYKCYECTVTFYGSSLYVLSGLMDTLPST